MLPGKQKNSYESKYLSNKKCSNRQFWNLVPHRIPAPDKWKLYLRLNQLKKKKVYIYTYIVQNMKKKKGKKWEKSVTNDK